MTKDTTQNILSQIDQGKNKILKTQEVIEKQEGIVNKYIQLAEEEKDKARSLKLRMEELELDLEKLQTMKLQEEKKIERLNRESAIL